ncbi:MAG: hypothetical protein KIT22_07450 [Verrucomicrobiae bacterium]|nr:hypothetical protein [Verrucomicrobiae bacterium]
MDTVFGTTDAERSWLVLWATAAALALAVGPVSRLPWQNRVAAALLAGGCGLLAAWALGRPAALAVCQSVVLLIGIRLAARRVLRRWSATAGYGAGVALLTTGFSGVLLAIGRPTSPAAAYGWIWAAALGLGYLLVTPWLLDKRTTGETRNDEVRMLK